jgi:hypothetical protein
MEYQLFETEYTTARITKLPLRIFVPKPRLEHRDRLLKNLNAYGIETTEQTTFSIEEYDDSNLDSFKIFDRVTFNGTTLQLMTTVTNIHRDRDSETYRSEYLKFAGSEAENWLAEEHVRPPSNDSGRVGIHFSPQDNLEMLLKLCLEEKTFAQAGFLAKPDLYFCPRALLSFPHPKDAPSHITQMHKLFSEGASKFNSEKGNSYSIKNTAQGADAIEFLIDCYATGIQIPATQ